jgi:uncharacterized glyoxalase superfamily metalloenzyme YdcJ
MSFLAIGSERARFYAAKAGFKAITPSARKIYADLGQAVGEGLRAWLKRS